VDCGKMQGRLNAYLDGELPLTEQKSVEEHLRSCPVCRERVQQAVRLAALLASIPVPEVPPDLAERIRAMARQRRRRVIWGGWWREASTPMRAAASLVLAVALTLGTLMSWKITQPDPPLVAAAFDYGLDSFAGAPDGSLEQAYLTLLSSSADERP